MAVKKLEAPQVTTYKSDELAIRVAWTGYVGA